MLPLLLRVGSGTDPPKKEGMTLRTIQWNWLAPAPLVMVTVAEPVSAAFGQAT